jgi:SUKH-4 immunity protein
MHDRLMNAAAIQSVIASRLPQRARWLLGGNMPLDFSLHTEPRKLTAEFGEWGLSGADVADIEQVSEFIVFGMWNFCEGGGARPALVVRESDGKVFSVDVEADDPVVLLNSSLEAFIETFCLLDKYLGHGQPIPADLNSLVRNLDPTAYSESEWRLVMD